MAAGCAGPTEKGSTTMSNAIGRRGFLGLAGLAVGTTALTACGGKESAPTTSTPAASSASSVAAGAAATPSAMAADKAERADADLVIWCDNDRYPVIKKYADQFASENGITAAVQVSADVRAQFANASKVGKGPDVIIGAHDWLGEMVQNGTVAPIQLDAATQAKFKKETLDATRFNGQTYGVPYARENIGLVRNTEMCPEAPKSLEELLAMAKGKGSQPLVMQVSPKGDAYYSYPWLSAFGGGIFAQKPNGEFDPTQIIVNSEGSVKGAQILADLGKAKTLSTNIDFNIANDLFNKKKSPFIITGPWSIDAMSKAGIKYAISPLPTLTGGGAMQPFLGIQMFYVSSKAKNAPMAQEFVTKAMTTKEAQIDLFKVGHRPPALVEAYDEVQATDADVKAWYEAGKDAKPMPNIPAMAAVWEPLGLAEADIVAGKALPKARLDAAAAEIKKNIK